MNKRVRFVAFFTKRNNEESEKVSNFLKDRMVEKGIDIIEFKREKIDNTNLILKTQIDLAIAIGGDGTTIKAFRTLPSNVPVLCINAGGTRGILSEVSKDSVSSITDPLLNGEYILDKRIRIVAHIGNDLTVPVLNDFVLMRSELDKTPIFSLSINDCNLNQKMDGLIISTPTGSTGHSLSNNGPILQENLECLLITPIGSVNRMPSFVSPLNVIEVSANHETQLIMDGQITRVIPKNQIIAIVKYNDDALFVRFKKNDIRQLTKLGFT
ncbi:MAG TPA: NAD(+)/NADH kinase [Candidatus Nitrosocosmicus sp.]|nr:NAD(+)/NADH kinase [Candidatus Nitrosocosmicus sp.]